MILVTHATRSLEMCDRVVVMGSGGLLCFDGTPRGALEFFGVDHYDEIYSRIEHTSIEWSSYFAESIEAEHPTKAEPVAPSRARLGEPVTSSPKLGFSPTDMCGSSGGIDATSSSSPPRFHSWPWQSEPVFVEPLHQI